MEVDLRVSAEHFPCLGVTGGSATAKAIITAPKPAEGDANGARKLTRVVTAWPSHHREQRNGGADGIDREQHGHETVASSDQREYRPQDRTWRRVSTRGEARCRGEG